uniref:Coatomer subunit delta n=1 Tax=Ditylenchus dipsaci TaxID=166011 RepID=A0A915D308_9BILA
MVLIAASVMAKGGNALVTRQYVADMTRARLEGLLDAFPKLLVGSEKTQRQHTFVETDSVRYVYQPLDNVYMVLVTTKASNILEDLETLRLFSRVIPEYCRSNEETEILDKAFDLIFAFDEIVVLGYRESVNLAQVRTFTEMDSHEERVFNQIQIAQQRAATNMMNEKVKEIKKAEKLKKSLRHGGGSASSATAISSSSSGLNMASKDFGSTSSNYSAPVKPTPIQPMKSAAGGGKALKLGSKSTTDDIFLQQLKSEGQILGADSSSKQQQLAGSTVLEDVTEQNTCPVQFKCVEKITSVVTRDGALDTCEIIGSVSLYVTDPKFNTVAIRVAHEAKEGGAQLQVHPNLDKKIWQANSLLRLKSAEKPFPVNVDVGVLKWRLQLPDEESLPLALNCWPNESQDGCVINIEYTLQKEDWELNNVTITIPLPPATVPIVSECEGAYEYIKSKSMLVWTVAVIDTSNKTGVLEFSTPNGHAEHFFPVNVRFASGNLFCKIAVEGVETMSGGEPVEYHAETKLVTEKYEIL